MDPENYSDTEDAHAKHEAHFDRWISGRGKDLAHGTGRAGSEGAGQDGRPHHERPGIRPRRHGVSLRPGKRGPGGFGELLLLQLSWLCRCNRRFDREDALRHHPRRTGWQLHRPLRYHHAAHEGQVRAGHRPRAAHRPRRPRAPADYPRWRVLDGFLHHHKAVRRGGHHPREQGRPAQRR